MSIKVPVPPLLYYYSFILHYGTYVHSETHYESKTHTYVIFTDIYFITIRGTRVRYRKRRLWYRYRTIGIFFWKKSFFFFNIGTVQYRIILRYHQNFVLYRTYRTISRLKKFKESNRSGTLNIPGTHICTFVRQSWTKMSTRSHNYRYSTVRMKCCI